METNKSVRNVIVAVDVQNDFINGSLAVDEGEQVINPINEVAALVRSSGGEAVFTRDWHPYNTLHFDKWPAHCVKHTDGAAFHPDLVVKPEDTIISKGIGRLQHGYSGWEGTSDNSQTLEAIIAPRSPEENIRVFLGGLATDYCVKATALDVANHFEDDGRVELYLLRDAIRAVNIQPEDESEALNAMLDAKIAAISSDEARRLIEGTAS